MRRRYEAHIISVGLLSVISPLDYHKLFYQEDTTIFLTVDGAKDFLKHALQDGASFCRDIRIVMALSLLEREGFISTGSTTIFVTT